MSISLQVILRCDEHKRTHLTHVLNSVGRRSPVSGVR